MQRSVNIAAGLSCIVTTGLLRKMNSYEQPLNWLVCQSVNRWIFRDWTGSRSVNRIRWIFKELNRKPISLQINFHWIDQEDDQFTDNITVVINWETNDHKIMSQPSQYWGNLTPLYSAWKCKQVGNNFKLTISENTEHLLHSWTWTNILVKIHSKFHLINCKI